MPQPLAASQRKDPPLPLTDQDAPDRADEPSIRRWPRALRLIFVLLAGVVAWAMVIAIAWFVLRRFGL
jgi:hypothetical protein